MMTPDERVVLEIIEEHVGYDRAISRHLLASRLGTHERQISAIVESLRKNHRKPILANPESGGYFLPTCEDDERRALAPRLAKVRSEFETIQTLSATVAHELAADLFAESTKAVTKPPRICHHPHCDEQAQEGSAYCSTTCKDQYLYAAERASWHIAEWEMV